ncbi:MAG: glycosyltransferase, partial [Verrucomicrobia bacterium]|nr:glycosyltransferase [Verrucomicrobiota bacterium]
FYIRPGEGVPAHFVGFKNQSELPPFYAAADFLVLPSVSETWGLVVNEAMACGLPAIVSETVGCAPDLVTEGETGFTFPTGSEAGLMASLRRCVEQCRAGHDFRPALAARMQVYSVEAAVAGLLQAVRTLRSEGGRA